MPKVDCSELQKTLSDLALYLASEPGTGTLARVVEEMKKRVDPALTREIVSDAIVAASQTKERAVDETAKHLTDIRKEARDDAKLRAKIDTARKALEQGRLPEGHPKKARGKPTDEIAALKEVQARLQAQLRHSEPAQRKRIEASIKRLEGQMAALKAGEYVAPQRREPIPASKAIERAIYERDKLRSQVRHEIRALEPKSPLQKLLGATGNAANLQRTLMTSYDLPPIGRQGLFFARGHPILASKAFVEAIRGMANPARAHRINMDIEDGANFPLMERLGLRLKKPGEDITERDEQFQTTFLKYIPGAQGVERGWTTFINKLQYDVADQLIHSFGNGGGIEEVGGKALMSFVNDAVGRSKLPGRMEHAAADLNKFIFAPRLWYSRVRLAVGAPMYGGTAASRKIIAKEYARSAAGFAVLAGIGVLAGGKLGTDPTKPDFLQLSFTNKNGDKTVIDINAGLSQFLVLASRIASGKSTSLKGKVSNVRGKRGPYDKNAFELAADYGRKKLSPLVGAGVDLAVGEDVIGQPVTLGGAALKLVTPLSARDYWEAMDEEGVPKKFARMALSALGFNNYDTEKK